MYKNYKNMKEEIVNVDVNGICVRKMENSNLMCLSDYLKGIHRDDFNFASALLANSVRMKISEIVGEKIPLSKSIKFLKSKKYWKTTGARHTKLVWVYEDIFNFIVEYMDKIHETPNYISYENQFYNILHSIFYMFDIKCQFYCEGAYIDFYIPELNLAIEYDERKHRCSDIYFFDRLREKKIIEKIKCKFVRVDIDDEFKGISLIINEIVNSDSNLNKFKEMYTINKSKSIS